MSDQWSMRPYAHGDESRINALHRAVFGIEKTGEYWNWLLQKNPFSAPVVWLAETPAKELIGGYCLIPIPFWNDGRRETAVLSIHSMVHPAYQRKGILKQLSGAAEKELEEKSIHTRLAFLNDNSFHVYVKHFGWQRLCEVLPAQFHILDFAPVLQKYLKSRSLSRMLGTVIEPLRIKVFADRTAREIAGGQLRRITAFDERATVLWEKLRNRIRFSVDRSAEYMNWRIVQKPIDYEIHVAEDGPNLLGIVITSTGQKFGHLLGYIVDLYCDPASPDTGVLLMAKALEVLRSKGCGLVTALAIDPFSLDYLRQAGFQALPRRFMPHGIHFCFYKTPHTAAPGLSAPSNWMLSWSDHDVV